MKKIETFSDKENLKTLGESVLHFLPLYLMCSQFS